MNRIFQRSSKVKAAELQKQIDDLANQKQEFEQAQRWNELQLQAQLKREREEHDRKAREWADAENVRIQEENIRRAAEHKAKLARDAEELKAQERDKARRDRIQATTPEALRSLRDLIRTRYELDMYIWSLKGARGPDRPLVVEKMEKADAVLLEINNIVDTWTENDKIWTKEEWRLAVNIRDRVKEDKKRWWAGNPPWNE